MSMWKVAYKYALLCGVFLLLTFWISYRFGSNPLIDFRHLFFDLILFGLFIFFASKEFKTYRNGGILHFWQGLTLALFTYAPATILFFLGLLLFFWFDPSLMADFRAQASSYLLQNKEAFLMDLSENEFNERLKQIDEVTTGQLMSGAVFKKLLAGFFVSPVVSIILRKRPN